MERRYASRVEEHAAEVAEHFSQSTDPDDLEKAVHYGEVAAQRAMSVYAYSEAARHLEAAIQAQEVHDPEDRARRFDLMADLMRAQLPAGELEAAITDVAPAAWELAEHLGDDPRRGIISRLAMDAAGRRLGEIGRAHV